MKSNVKNSTYKLFGTIWDGQRRYLPTNYLENTDYINDWKSDYNLFDILEIRKINISDILKVEDERSLDLLLNRIKIYSSIIIIIDFYPSENNIVRMYYNKIVQQICYCFHNRLPDTMLYIVNDEDRK